VRKFLLVVVLSALAWIFVVPSCSTKFGCEASGAVAHADDQSCPSTMGEAAKDTGWAAAQFLSIKDDKITTGLFYDDDGIRHTFVSGEDGAERAAEVLAEVGAPASPIRTYPAASHVEVKAAVAMRDGDVTSGVMVINHSGGPCPGDLGCATAVPYALPDGAWLVVWWRGAEGMRSQRFEGGGG
jgi:hypothetical protein